jgi:hypothetical protein
MILFTTLVGAIAWDREKQCEGYRSDKISPNWLKADTSRFQINNFTEIELLIGQRPKKREIIYII